MTVNLTWVRAGTFHLTFVVTFAGGGVKEYDFNRVVGQDL